MQLNHYLNFQGETEVPFFFINPFLEVSFLFKRYSELPDVQVSEQEKDYLYIFHYPLMNLPY